MDPLAFIDQNQKTRQELITDSIKTKLTVEHYLIYP